MSKRPALYLVAAKRTRGRQPKPDAVERRETSWRDLVRRLAKSPLKD